MVLAWNGNIPCDKINRDSTETMRNNSNQFMKGKK